MQLTVKLFAYFRDNRFKEREMDFVEGTTILDVVHFLNLPENELGVIMVNSRHSSLERQLKEGDIVALFPPIGGG
jgi:molybdopterin synthase sulfur carrier subunit